MARLRGPLTRFASRKLLEVTEALRRTYPRTIEVRALLAEGCRFEAAGPLEARRVSGLGGEPDFIARILRAVRGGAVLFDVGACIGLVTCHAALAGARVWAFEPGPDYRARLERNLELNGLDGVEVVPWAVTDGPGQTVLHTGGVEAPSPRLRAGQRTRTITVPTDSLDGAIARGELPRPDLVKMDIEGAEALAIPGMASLLASDEGPSSVFLELHPGALRAYGSTSEEVLDALTRQGYDVVYEATRGGQVLYEFRR